MKKVIMGLALAVFGLYYYSDVILSYGLADDECLKFAERSKVNIAFNPDPVNPKIFVVKKWVKGSKVVVELGQYVAGPKSNFNARLCVIGGGQISLPSMLEQWQYR
jgi:hypothetical protein